MTRQEAMTILRNEQPHCGDKIAFSEAEKYEAFNMAIEALQHEQERGEDIYECPNCIGEVHKNYIYCPFCGIKVGE